MINKIVSPKITALTFGILTICFLIAFYVVAWQEPAQSPPEGNVPAPLNVGPEGQSKEGGLILNTGGALYGLIVDQGLTKLGGSLILHPISRPTSPETGQIYFDQNNQALYYYNGTTWIRIGPECTTSEHCGLCEECQNGICVDLPAGTQDTWGPETCTELHYRCDGDGHCTAPKIEAEDYQMGYCYPDGDSFSGENIDGNTKCANMGHDGCYNMRCSSSRIGAGYCRWRPSSICSMGGAVGATCRGRYIWTICWDWAYDH